MGLLSTMNDVVESTNKFVNSINSFHCNIPTGRVGKILGLDDFQIRGLSDISSAVGEVGSAVAQSINMIDCATSLSTWTGMLGALAYGVSDAALGMLQTIQEAISAQLRAAVQQVVGTLINFVTSIMNLIANICLLFKAIMDLSSWFDLSLENLKLALNREECVNMMSSIAACILNKYLGEFLDELESDILDSINDVGNSINNKISDAMEDTNLMASYINREAFLIKKAQMQVAGLSPENVLKYGID